MKAETREEGWRLGEPEIAALIAGTHDDPFAVLGPHLVGDTWIARAVVSGRRQVTATTLDGRPLGKLERRGPGGIFRRQDQP